jgi:hypothetical protein
MPHLADKGVVFPAFEVAERQSLNFKPTDDIVVDFKYTGNNAFVLSTTASRIHN